VLDGLEEVTKPQSPLAGLSRLPIVRAERPPGNLIRRDKSLNENLRGNQDTEVRKK